MKTKSAGKNARNSLLKEPPRKSKECRKRRRMEMLIKMRMRLRKFSPKVTVKLKRRLRLTLSRLTNKKRQQRLPRKQKKRSKGSLRRLLNVPKRSKTKNWNLKAQSLHPPMCPPSRRSKRPKSSTDPKLSNKMLIRSH